MGTTSYAHEPEWFTTAPVTAMNNLLANVGWNAQEVDLYEINEAFASVTMAAVKDMNLDIEKVNVNGGAVCTWSPYWCIGRSNIGYINSCA